MIKRVYIAGNYSRNSEGKDAGILEILDNIRAGQKVSLEILRMGYAVYCPFLDYQFGLIDDEPVTDIMYKENGLAWLEVSDALVVISGKGLGYGVDFEIDYAKKLSIQTFYGIKSFNKWR